VSLSVSLLALFLRCCSRYMSPTSWMYTLHTCLTWGHACNCVPRCVHVRHVSETVKERLLCPCFLGFCVWLTTIFTLLSDSCLSRRGKKETLQVFCLGFSLCIHCKFHVLLNKSLFGLVISINPSLFDVVHLA
jgi:hypothetical protein